MKLNKIIGLQFNFQSIQKSYVQNLEFAHHLDPAFKLLKHKHTKLYNNTFIMLVILLLFGIVNSCKRAFIIKLI